MNTLENNTDALFATVKINQTLIGNKLSVAPMTRVSANSNGSLGPLMHEYYDEFAQGGFGLIITEGLYTDLRYSQAYRYQPGIANKEQALSWSTLIEAAHAKGSVVVAQLMHGGALSQYNPYTSTAAAPSAVLPKGNQMSLYYGSGPYRMPVELSQKDIAEVVEGFVQSSVNAWEAGFDGVEIHGANGYLLDQFITTYTNQRSDQYGGALTNRLRIIKEILVGVRQAVSDDFIVGIRFSQKKVNDDEYVWAEGNDVAKELFGLVREYGADYIHTTEPVLNERVFDSNLPFAALAKQYSGLPVIANGGVVKPDLAVQMIQCNYADMISLGKTALANPNWPAIVKTGGELREFSYDMLSPIADLAHAKCFKASQNLSRII